MPYRLIGLIAVLSLVGSVASTAPAEPPYVKPLEKGKELMQKGDFEDALRSLQKARRLSGAKPPVEVLVGLSYCSSRLGDSSGAEDFARQAITAARDPVDRARAHNMLGLALLYDPGTDPERLAAAESAFRTVLDVTQGQANAGRFNLAEVLERQARYEEAQALFAEFLERLPEPERQRQAATVRHRMDCLAQVDPTGAPLRVGGEVGSPTKISGPNPGYTADAREKGVQGTILFEARIDRFGNLTDLELLQGLDEELDRVALDRVREWKFTPGTLDGCPVDVIYSLTVNFRLE